MLHVFLMVNFIRFEYRHPDPSEAIPPSAVVFVAGGAVHWAVAKDDYPGADGAVLGEVGFLNNVY